MNRWFTCIALFAATICLFSCNNQPSKDHGPIVLGDSSTIVTETDPARLQDMVTDVTPTTTIAPEPIDTPATAQAEVKTDTPKTAAAPEPEKVQPAKDVAGLRAEFKDVTVVIPGVTAKIAGSGNLANANGAVYSFISGNINGNTLKITGSVTKVSQRYQSVVVLKNDMGELPLETLSLTTGWETVKGSGGNYRITDLDEKSLEREEANKSQIQAAVRKAAQRRRMSRRRIDDWVSSVRNVRNTEQRPLTVVLRSVMWKIDGKDASGRAFSKQIRIDIPM